MPVSSKVSRNAVSTGVKSPVSLRPPGKLTWPLCRARLSVRRVNNNMGWLRSITGSNTAAFTAPKPAGRGPAS